MKQDNYRRPRTVLELRSSYWAGLGPKAKKAWVEKAFRYWRRRGFPHYQLSDSEIRREFERLCQVQPGSVIRGEEIRACTTGLRLANYFHPHMWEISVGRYRNPAQAFSDDKLLRLCIEKALTVCNDRPPLSLNSLRRMLISLTNTASVSNFRPAVARALVSMHSGLGDHILDYCAGFGGRMLGTLTLDRKYQGIEASKRTAKALVRMNQALNRLMLSRGLATISHGSAEDFLPTLPSRSVSLIITSPPYFNRERYSRDISQSFLRYKSYEVWRELFLATTIAESARILEKRGRLVLNVADCGEHPIARDAFDICHKELRHLCTFRLRIPLRAYQRNHKRQVYKYEQVFVFKAR